MSPIVNAWMRLNRDARRSCAEALKRLKQRIEGDPFARVCAVFLHKATETLSAVNVLYAHDLQEPAQGLIRVLFELRINFDCLIEMARKDMPGTLGRLFDSMMLEKVKQARASSYAGIPDEMRRKLDQAEVEISARYEPEDLNRIRKHGFIGVPIEQRAALTGHNEAYSVVYRNFSRNVHSTDYMESFFKAGIAGIKIDDDYLWSRDTVAQYTAHFSAVGIMEMANYFFALGMEEEIESLGARKAEIKDLQNEF